ncbi:MAG: GNAT family N-acetyltransferase [Clostridia bacterium]|nr:GNAT family N-acetyltransferase [Clostridia bacterium]
MQIRPYQASDAKVVLSWCQEERAFYQWTAGILGAFPLTEAAFAFVETLMPFTAVDEEGPVGFFTLRRPGQAADELRFGFVIVAPDRRGQGIGKTMLQQGMQLAFGQYGVSRVSLGVFENNSSAYYCYRAAGFEDVTAGVPESYQVLGEEWLCRELQAVKRTQG